jgi:phosphatidylglycerol:prolipoprotein diacylglycerol transferase
MIDPIIFSFKLFNWEIVLRWYGVLVMFGAVVGAWLAEREIRRRGENGEAIWDAMVWVLPIGILGARVWYIVNNILGGGTYYIENPIKILYVWEGGLHIFGGFLFGVVALYFFLKSVKKDVWLFLDAIAPAALLGQALARPANFINQELYGQPTKLPWGIPIDAGHRLAEYADVSKFPVETTRFHPTFAYEMILNILLALLLLWISGQYKDKMKPGAIFAGWLVFAGLARTFIEFFRPDQPRIGDSFVSYTMLVSFLMAIAGMVMLLVRYGRWQFTFAEGWQEEYQIQPVEKKERVRVRALAKSAVEEDKVVSKPLKKKTAMKAKTSATAKTVKKAVNKTTAKSKTSRK